MTLALPGRYIDAMPADQYVTKQELEVILDERFEKLYVRLEKMMYKIVGEVAGEIVGEALQLISERFDKLEAQMERMADDHDRTKATVARHSIDIRALKRKTA